MRDRFDTYGVAGSHSTAYIESINVLNESNTIHVLAHRICRLCASRMLRKGGVGGGSMGRLTLRYLPVQEGAVPETRIKLRYGDTLVVDSLAGIVQLNALRRTLAEGFQAHLQVRMSFKSCTCLFPHH